MMDTFQGYSGKLLRVDLAHEKITDEKLDEETARKYLGGTETQVTLPKRP